MSNPQSHHPGDGLLLRYIDGELPARKVRQVGRHLEACWQCRSEVEELQSTVAGCVRYRKNVLEAHLPAPPRAWTGLDREFDRLDAEFSQEPWMARLKRSLGSPALRWGVAVAAACVMAVVVVQQFRETPAVEAATLLKRAVAAADSHPGVERRIRIRTRNQQTTRVIGGRRPVPAEEASTAALHARFQAAQYNWDDPLSARAYQGWRDGLDGRQDEVTTSSGPQSPAGSCYRIRTIAAGGSLAAASLMLRMTDLRPVEGRLEFRDGEWVEFTELPETTRNTGGPVAAIDGGPAGQREPGPSAATGPEPTASVSDELQVLAALHEIGADLGDPVDVTRSAGRIVVSGMGISRERRKQIHDRMDRMPLVDIRFSDPAAAPLPAEPAEPASAPSASPPAEIQTRVERQVGGHAEFQKLSSLVLDRNDSMMSRAYALRTLARRFPVDDEARLTPGDRQVLRDMAREHATGLALEASGIERALNPVLASLGGSVAANTVASQTSWQSAAEELWRASRRVEVLVSVALGVSPGDSSAGRLPSEVLSAIRDLRADLAQFQQLLAQ